MANNDRNILIKNIFLGSVSVMVLSNVTIFAGSLVDSILISRFLGTECMAAYGIVVPITLIIIMISLVFSSGLQNECSALLTRGKSEEASSVMTASIVLEICIGFLMALVMFFFSGNVADVLLLGHNGGEDLKKYVCDYMVGLAPGMIVLCILPSLSFLMYLEGKGKVVTQSVGLQLAVNIVGDICNVTVFHKGMLGMGAATSLCYYVSLLAFIFGIIKNPGSLRLTFANIRMRDTFAVIRSGASTALERLYVSVRTLALNGLLLSVAGSSGVAAFSVMITLQNIYNALSIGICATTQTAAGAFSGEEDGDSLRSLIKTSITYGSAMDFILAIIVFFTASVAGGFFVSDHTTDTYALTVQAIRLFALSMPFYNMNSIFQKFYLGMKQFKLTYVFGITNNFICILIFAFSLSKIWGTNGVWLSFVCSEIVTLVIVFIYTSVKLGRRPSCIEDFAHIPQNCEHTAEEEFYGGAETMEQVAALSKGIEEFCIEKNTDEKTAKRASLFVEEMAGNIIRWGSNKAKSKHIDVRMVITDSNQIIRIRDDCEKFDPSQWYEIHHSDKNNEYLGIRLSFGLAKEINYINLMGMNQLSIKFS